LSLDEQKQRHTMIFSGGVELVKYMYLLPDWLVSTLEQLLHWYGVQ
jgi:hypothetical protein